MIMRVAGDRIVDLWSNYDEFGLLHECGTVAASSG
jgi:hypothetical protein